MIEPCRQATATPAGSRLLFPIIHWAASFVLHFYRSFLAELRLSYVRSAPRKNGRRQRSIHNIHSNIENYVRSSSSRHTFLST